MLIASLIFSAILVAIVSTLVLKNCKLRACRWAFVAIFFGLPFVFFPGLALTGILLIVLTVVYACVRFFPRWYVAGTWLAFVLAHACVVVIALVDGQYRQKLREEYPSESMATRLAYSKRSTRTAAQAASANHNRPVLDEDDRLTDASWRNQVLRRLHNETVTSFINSPGFGVSRMERPGRKAIELPEAPPIRLPEPEYTPTPSPTDPSAVPLAPAQAAASASDLEYLHRTSVLDFVNARGFGYVADRDHVMGFQAHHFHAMPAMKSHLWKVENLQLVSLLKSETPGVYLSQNLPRMSELTHAETRPLDDFEEKSLTELEKGASVQTESAPDRIRMMGAIRAVDQCLKCHDASRGDLLGAFTYTLRRQ
jgi:hypothetical protein